MKNLILILLLASIFTACSKKEDNIKASLDSSQGNQDQQEDLARDQKTKFVEESDVQSFGLDRYQKLKSYEANILRWYKTNKTNFHKQSVEEINNSIVKDLFPAVVDTSWIHDPRVKGSDELVNAVQLLNQALINIIKRDPNNKSTNKTIASYVDFITKGCKTGDCENLKYFYKYDHTTSELLFQYAKTNLSKKVEANVSKNDSNQNKCLNNKECEDAIKEYYFVLDMAREATSRRLPAEYSIYYVFYASAYIDLLSEESRSKSRYKKTVQSKTVNMLKSFEIISRDSKDNKEVIELLKSALLSKETFLCSRERGDPSCVGFLSVVSQFMLEGCDRNDKRSDCALEKNFEDAIDEKTKSVLDFEGIQTVVDNDFFNLNIFDSYKYFEMMEDGIGQRVLENFDLSVNNKTAVNKSINPFNIWFYYIDAVYKGDLAPTDILEIEQKLQLAGFPAPQLEDVEKFEEIMLSYMRTELLRLNFKTNQVMGDFYETGTVGQSNTELIQKTFDRALTITDDWNDLDLRFKNVKDTAKNIFPIFTEEVFEIEKKVKEIKKTINNISVYPNMIMLHLYMSLKRFSLKFRTYFGTVEIDYKDLVHIFLTSGYRQPWFDFGDKDTPLVGFGILYSLYFGHKTGVFESFATTILKAKKLDPGFKIETAEGKFYVEIIKAFIDDEFNVIRDNIDSMRESTDSDHLDEVIKVCREISDNPNDFDKPLSFSIDKLKNITSTRLDKLSYLKLSDMPHKMVNFSFKASDVIGKSDNVLSDFMRLYDKWGKRDVSAYLNYIARVITPRLMYVESMLDVYESFIKEQEEKNIITGEELLSLKEEISAIKMWVKSQSFEIDEIQQKAFSIEEGTGSCLYALQRIYRNRTADLLDLEREKIDNRYDYVKIIDSLNNSGKFNTKFTDLSSLGDDEELIYNKFLTFHKSLLKKYDETIHQTSIEDLRLIDLVNLYLKISRKDLALALYPNFDKDNPQLKGPEDLLPEDVGTYCRDLGGDYCGYDQILVENNQLKLELYQVDFVLRAVINLRATVAPDVQILPMTKFENISEISEVKIVVNYSEDRDAFVEKYMRSHHHIPSGRAFSYWWDHLKFSGLTASPNTKRFEFLRNLYSLGSTQTKSQNCYKSLLNETNPVLAMSTISDCEVDEDYLIDANYLVEDHKFFLQTIGMSEKEITLVKSMGKDSLLEDNFIKSLFFKENDIREFEPVFDLMLSEIKELSDVYNGLLLQFYNQTVSLGSLVFDYNLDLICEHRKRYMDFVVGKYQLLESLRDTIVEMEQSQVLEKELGELYFRVDEKLEFLGRSIENQIEPGYFDQEKYIIQYDNDKKEFFDNQTAGYFGLYNEEGKFEPNPNLINSDRDIVYECKNFGGDQGAN